MCLLCCGCTEVATKKTGGSLNGQDESAHIVLHVAEESMQRCAGGPRARVQVGLQRWLTVWLVADQHALHLPTYAH